MAGHVYRPTGRELYRPSCERAGSDVQGALRTGVRILGQLRAETDQPAIHSNSLGERSLLVKANPGNGAPLRPGPTCGERLRDRVLSTRTGNNKYLPRVTTEGKVGELWLK